MDSPLKPDLSKESSNTSITPKSSESEQKDSQAKPAGAKFTISLQSSSTSGSSSGGSAGAPTSAASDPVKVTTASSSFPSTTTTTSSSTSSSSGNPHSVTISLGVGALQVGKTTPRVPSPPKTSVTTSSTQDATSNPTTTTSSVSISPASVASALKEASKSLGLNPTIPTTLSSSTSSEGQQTTSGTDTTKTISITSAHSHLSITNPLASTNTTTASPAGATSSLTTSIPAMKRPPSEISGSMSSGTGSTNEPGESETGVEHKRKKMRKEPRGDRSGSDSPAGSSVTTGSGGRSSRNVGNKQGSGSSSSNVGETSQKAASADSTPSTKEKAEDSSKHHEASSTTNTGNGGLGSLSSTSSNGGGGPKVPPLKIVLQSHSHNVATTSANDAPAPTPYKGSAGSEETPSQSSTFGQGSTSSGFPYVVSVTTAETSSTSETAQTTSSGTGSSSAHDQKDNSKEAAGKDGPFKIMGPTSSTNSGSANTANEATASSTSPTSTAATTASGTTTSSTLFTSAASGSDKGKINISSTNESSSLSLSTDKNKYDEEKKDVGNSGTGGTRPSTPAIGGDLDKEKESSGKDKDSNAKESGASGSHSTDSGKKEKEKPVRVTRSSQRILKEGGTLTPNSPSSSSPKTSACPSPSHSHQTDSQGSIEASSSSAKQVPAAATTNNEATDKVETNEQVELHPRKRKIKNKDIGKEKEKEVHHHHAPAPPPPSVASTSSNSSNAHHERERAPPPENVEQQQMPGQAAANEQPMLNCFEMYLNIRKQIDRRRRNLFPVTPKPPKGFKDYLMNRGTYVLAGNANALAVPLINPPQNLTQQMKDFFSEQEKDRHKLRLQHLVEKEKLVLSVEQEILRVHGRAARALSNQTLPFSVCTILKDQEVYNLLTPEQEEKDINARSRYNGRLFLSWLQDVDDKWDKIKEYMLLRHHNEAESLHAVQKMDWEWKLKEFGICEVKANPIIDELHVPMVHVSDDFDLLPA